MPQSPYTHVIVEIHIEGHHELAEVEEKIDQMFQNTLDMKAADWWDYYKITPSTGD